MVCVIIGVASSKTAIFVEVEPGLMANIFINCSCCYVLINVAASQQSDARAARASE